MKLASGQEVTYNSLAMQVGEILGVELKMPMRNVKVPQAPTSLNKKAARGRIYCEEILGAGVIRAEYADEKDVETLTQLIENAETQMETKESSDVFCLSLEMSEQEVKKRVEVLKNLRRDCAIKLSTERFRHTLSKRRSQRLDFKTPTSSGQASPAMSTASRSKSPTPKPSPPLSRRLSPHLSPPMPRRGHTRTGRRSSSKPIHYIWDCNGL